MCIFSIPVHVSSRNYHWPRVSPNRYNRPALVYPTCSTEIQHLVSGGLWNCQSAVPKADFISGYASLQTLDVLDLTETWITPFNTSTPTALSTAYSFSHTPRPTGRGGGIGLLLSPKWSFSLFELPNCTPSTFEFHAVTVTHPIQLTIVVLYRPPGALGNFLEELDNLLSHIPETGPPAVLLGDFNLQTGKIDELTSLLTAFAFSLSPSPPTHKAGNVLDLIFSRNCTTSNLSVNPLHTSDHFFISFSLPLSKHNKLISSHPAPVRHNLRSLSPSTFASSVLSALPSSDSFQLQTLLQKLSSLLSHPLWTLSVLSHLGRLVSPLLLPG
ncbi:hypothetical protein CgunFtcFv8_013617 [Champsocephalus gunnari]|uniref:Endonuclease/exonuclease/phosphatase domain-containing protein n=1 Tax=Champsocephalus gunnari TaxID=52237 RepID=A0AAN8DXN5_CHAGU|nr:hypothetical protein CgunFtcFv8_013617 [Champsocephalus gunnari]